MFSCACALVHSLQYDAMPYFEFLFFPYSEKILSILHFGQILLILSSFLGFIFYPVLGFGDIAVSGVFIGAGYKF